jgi:hypothetical protein
LVESRFGSGFHLFQKFLGIPFLVALEGDFSDQGSFFDLESKNNLSGFFTRFSFHFHIFEIPGRKKVMDICANFLDVENVPFLFLEVPENYEVRDAFVSLDLDG